MTEHAEVFKAWLGDKCAGCCLDFSMMADLYLERIERSDGLNYCVTCALTDEPQAILDYIARQGRRATLILLDLDWLQHNHQRVPPPLPFTKNSIGDKYARDLYKQFYERS